MIVANSSRILPVPSDVIDVKLDDGSGLHVGVVSGSFYIRLTPAGETQQQPRTERAVSPADFYKAMESLVGEGKDAL